LGKKTVNASNAAAKTIQGFKAAERIQNFIIIKGINN